LATLNIARAIRRAVWTLLGLCLPALIHAAPLTSTAAAAPKTGRVSSASATYGVSKFISSGEQACLEVTVDGILQKIYTEHNADYKALLVFGERDNPELLQFSFRDSSKRIVTHILEYRTEKDRVPPGRKVADNEFIQSLRSDADGFRDWQARFSSFPEKPTGSAVLTDASFGNPTGITIVDGDRIVFRIRDWLCFCQRGGIAAHCFNSVLRCAFDNLCAAWGCIEAGEWSAECHDSLERAKACLGMLE